MSDFDLRGAEPVGPSGDDSIDTRGAEGVTMQEPGIVTSLKRGFETFKMGFQALNASGAADMTSMLDRLKTEGDTQEMRDLADKDPLFANHYNLWKSQGMKPEILDKIKEQNIGEVGRSMEKIQRGALRTEALPASEGYKAFQETKDTEGALKALAKHPIGITAEVTAESLGGQTASIPLTIAAGVAGGPGPLAAATGGASFLQEYGSDTLELLMKSGVDVNDPAAVAATLASPQFKAAQAMKMRKAAVVGTLDAVTAGIAGVALAASPAKNIAAQTAVQMAGGGAGEALGSVAAGDEIHPASVIAEMIGELPGGVKDVGSLAIGRSLRSKALSDAADAKEQEALTGLAPAQADVKNEIAGQNVKPKLSPLQSRIVVEAANNGIDPQTALVIGSIESNFRPDAKNPKSTAQGIFQQLDSTWEAVGGGDRNDVHTQIVNGIRGIAQTKSAMTRLLGTEPTGDELYMGHLFGPKGAATILQAEPANPQGSFLDTVRKYDPTNAEAIVNSNGLQGLTNEEAVNKVRGWFTKHNVQLGGDQRLNEITKASPNSDAAPNPEGKSSDAIIDEIDAMLAEVELKPPTEADIAEAAAEETSTAHPVAPDAEIENIEFQADDETKEILNQVPPAEPMLPRELSGAKPHLGLGSRQFEVQFESDLDRAAYIVANTDKKSARDADYLKFAMDNTGMTEREVRDYGQAIRRRLKELAAATKDEKRTAITYPKDQRFSDSGTTMAELQTRDRTANPNDKISVSDLPIINEGLEGKTLKQHKIEPGQVVALGVDSEQTPIEYMKAMQETMQSVIQRFAPDARLAVSFKTEDDGSVSNYRMMGRMGKTGAASGRSTGLYLINMRNAKNLGRGTDSTRNPTTHQKIAYATYHELGHVIADHEFTKGMQPQTLAKFRARGEEALNVYFDETDFQGLTPEQVAVLQDYNNLKRQVLTNPRFTVSRFMDAWLSPWKLGHGWGAGQGKVSFLRNFFGAVGEQSLNEPARTFATSMHMSQNSNILSPHEYMAEQMARYAYSSRAAENSPLAVKFFQQALKSLREFFQSLKKGGDIKPGVAFAEWVDSLTQTTQEHNDRAQNKAVPEPEPVRKPAKPRVKLADVQKKKAAPTEEPKPMLPPANDTIPEIAKVISTAVPDHIAQAQAVLNSNKGLLALKKNLPGKFKAFEELVAKGKIDDFLDQATVYMTDEEADKARWDTDVPEHMDWRDVEQNLVKTLPKRAGLKNWFGNGLRRLSDKKNYIMNMRQMAYAHPDVAGLQTIEMMMTAMKAYKSKLELRGLEASTNWSKLGKEQAGLLEQAMKEEHYLGEHFAELAIVNKTWRFVPTKKLLEYAARKGLDEGTVKVWLDVKNAHLQHMNALQNVLRQKIQTRYEGKPKTIAVKTAELHQMFQSIRATPFIPQTRFGDYALQVVEPTIDGTKVVHLEFFESAAMRDEARAHLEAAVGKDRKVIPANYHSSTHLLRTLPPQLLSTYAMEFDLTDTQRKELREIADVITKNPQTRRYSQQLAQITGANKSLLRNFADFMWHDSNNITKLYYGEHLRRGLRQIAEDMRDAALAGDFAKHDQLKSVNDFAHKYVQHMLSPADEWQTVRAFVVVKQLWGNVKTALVNVNSMAQLWAVASTQGGFFGGTAITGKVAFQQLSDSIHRTGQRALRQPVEGGQVFSPDQRWAMNMAKVDGLLDESFAAQLAQFANAGTLARLNYQADSLVKRALWLGMLPQHAVENYTRRVTLQTMFDIYMKQGLSREDAYAKAKRDVYLLQGDNTILNRPAFMRGKAAAFTIYYGYMQNMLYLMSGAQERARNLRNAIDSGKADKMTTEQAREKFYRMNWLGGETLKMWMAYAALGGLMGLPGAEDLDKILELVSTKFFGSRFSLKEHAYALATTISEKASDFGLDVTPRSIVHGNMSDFSMFGLLPSVDVSPSMSLGQALPGTGGIDKLGKKGGAGEFVLGAMGPLGSVVKQFGDLFGDDPGLAKKYGIFLPNTISGIAKTVDEWEHGVMYPSGGKVTVDMKTGEIRDLTTGENVARLMGFQPSIVTGNKELHWMQKDAADYWTARRNGLIAQAWEAKLHNDREAMADARKAIDEFNASADPKMRVTGKDLVRSFKAHRKDAKKDTNRESRQKRYRQLFGDIEGNFMGPSSDQE